jgi:hypothetical protein
MQHAAPTSPRLLVVGTGSAARTSPLLSKHTTRTALAIKAICARTMTLTVFAKRVTGSRGGSRAGRRAGARPGSDDRARAGGSMPAGHGHGGGDAGEEKRGGSMFITQRAQVGPSAPRVCSPCPACRA